MLSTILIIPAYNESECILKTVNTVVSAGFDYVVINDGSTDNTLEILKNNNINYLNLSQNLGIGGAVQAGHMYAYEYNYDIDVQFDGDGQHEISYVNNLIKRIEDGADLVVGSRFFEKTQGFQSTALRRVGIKWLSFWIKIFSGKRITDPTSGFRACGKRSIELFCKSYPRDYPEPESVVMAHKAGFSVDEIPVVMHSRQGGTSSISGLSSIYYMIKVSLAIVIRSFSSEKSV